MNMDMNVNIDMKVNVNVNVNTALKTICVVLIWWIDDKRYII